MTWLKKTAKSKPKTRSGTQWSDADYANAGYGRLGLRLLSGDLELLDVIARHGGASRSVVLSTLLHEHAGEVGIKRVNGHWVPPASPLDVPSPASPPINWDKVDVNAPRPAPKPRGARTTGRIR